MRREPRLNLDIRQHARKKDVYICELANELEISENTLRYRLRKPISDKDKAELVNLIDRIAAQRQQ